MPENQYLSQAPFSRQEELYEVLANQPKTIVNSFKFRIFSLTLPSFNFGLVAFVKCF